ncbi:MAG: aspartate kinase [Bdellovibrionales bacterium]|nr:aspartate kinase [Bdellovibrionales bacterium]
MNLVVKKFGGSSLASVEKIEQIADRLVEEQKKGERSLVVLSAMFGYTDSLIKMAHQIYPNYLGPAYDILLSSGEQISVALLSLALEKRAVKNKVLLAHQAGIQTSSFFSKAEIESIDTTKLENLLKEGYLPLVAGFQGITKDNQITTLGRGGSDLTAVALSASLKAEVCKIYTDVTGVFTADPRIYPSAIKIKELGFSEMMEMASLGSKVLQIRCVELASKSKVNIQVLHSSKKEEGTWIINKKETGMEGSVVSAIAHDLNTLVIKLTNTSSEIEFHSKLFSALGRESVFIDMISQSTHKEKSSLSFSIPHTDLTQTLKVLKDFVKEEDISIIDQAVKISVVGVGMAQHCGVAGRFFSALSQVKTQIYLLTTSEIKISAIIPEKNLKETVRVLHKEFFNF